MIGLLKIRRKGKKTNMRKPNYDLRDLTDSNSYIGKIKFYKDD